MQSFSELRAAMEAQFNRLQALGDYDANAESIRELTEAMLVTMIKIERLEERLNRLQLVD